MTWTVTDFAWKFVWIVRTITKAQSTKSIKKYKKVYKYKSTHNSVIFWATDSRFCIEVHMHCPTKWENSKVQKVQKYKNKKVQKYNNTKT